MEQISLKGDVNYCVDQWFPNFSDTRTTLKNLVVREAQNIDLYWELRTTLANLADHQWSAEQTLGITGVDHKVPIFYE